MKRQFETVSSRYGAPMGRRAAGHIDTDTPKSVRLFRVNLDSGGYDDGGAYWGLGQPLFCAIDKDGDRQFIRTTSRQRAALLFGIPNTSLCKPLAGGTEYGFALLDGRAPMPEGVDKSDVIEWLTRSGVPMGQLSTQ